MGACREGEGVVALNPPPPPRKSKHFFFYMAQINHLPFHHVGTILPLPVGGGGVVFELLAPPTKISTGVNGFNYPV